MSPIAKFVALAVLLVGGGIGVLALTRTPESASVNACDDSKSEAASPDAAYVAQMVVHTCAWGFGQAAESVDVKVTKLGKEGWFLHVPIEYDSTAEDQGTAKPTMAWDRPDALVITIMSKSRTGSLVSHYPGLTVTRVYRAS